MQSLHILSDNMTKYCVQYGPPPFLLNDNELLPFEHACMLREEHYSHPENLDSWESTMPTLWRFEVRWSIFGLSPLHCKIYPGKVKVNLFWKVFLVKLIRTK